MGTIWVSFPIYVRGQEGDLGKGVWDMKGCETGICVWVRGARRRGKEAGRERTDDAKLSIIVDEGTEDARRVVVTVVGPVCAGMNGVGCCANEIVMKT